MMRAGCGKEIEQFFSYLIQIVSQHELTLQAQLVPSSHLR
jgi:hypothetical protein